MRRVLSSQTTTPEKKYALGDKSDNLLRLILILKSVFFSLSMKRFRVSKKFLTVLPNYLYMLRLMEFFNDFLNIGSSH